MLTHLPLHHLHQILVTVEKAHLLSIYCWVGTIRTSLSRTPRFGLLAEYTTETKKLVRTEGDCSRLWRR